MQNINLIAFFTITLLISGCYQWQGELNTRITGLSLNPGADIVAIGIVEHYSGYPLLNFSGWSRGVPKVHGRKARIYFYNIKQQQIEEKMVIKFPKHWNAGNHEIALHLWTEEGIYFKLTGCTIKNQNCKEAKYYYLLLNGKVNQVVELPIVKGYLKGDSAYKTYNNGILTINVGHAGAWKPILLYKAHKLIPVDEN